MPPKKDHDFYYNAARKKEKEEETPEERAKYKLEAKNEKIWNRYMYVYPYSLSIRDIAEQQDITLVRAYQIVLDYGGIERLQQASDYKEVNDEIENEKVKQENISKLKQATLIVTHDTHPKNTAAKQVLVDIPGLNSKIEEHFGGKKRIRKTKGKSKKSVRKTVRKSKKTVRK
jgi:hypothetical protein